MRVLIAGGPKVGKTTFAEGVAAHLGVTAKSTDSLIGQAEWGHDSEHVAAWFAHPGPWVIEGTTVARAIRKWLKANPAGSPADIIFIGSRAKQRLTPGQITMLRGHETVWREVALALACRGVRVHDIDAALAKENIDHALRPLG